MKEFILTNLKRLVISVILIILTFTILRQYETIRELKSLSTKQETFIPDTVYKDSPPKIVKEYVYKEVPTTVTIYKDREVPVDRIISKTDTVFIYLKDSTKVSLNNKFLTLYPDKPKLLQLLLDENSLDFNLLSPNGTTYSLDYKINTNQYYYNFNGTNLTFKKKPFIKRFQPYTSYKFRLMNNYHDLSLGIKYKTSKFNYIMGVEGYYYPFADKLGCDVFFELEYEFF